MSVGETPETAELARASMLRLAVEGWRLAKFIERAGRNLETEQQRRIGSRLDYFVKEVQDELAKHGLRIIDFTGSEFNPQLPVTALNADEFDASVRLVITQQLEPVVVGEAGVVRTGTVLVERALG